MNVFREIANRAHPEAKSALLMKKQAGAQPWIGNHLSRLDARANYLSPLLARWVTVTICPPADRKHPHALQLLSDTAQTRLP